MLENVDWVCMRLQNNEYNDIDDDKQYLDYREMAIDVRVRTIEEQLFEDALYGPAAPRA